MLCKTFVVLLCLPAHDACPELAAVLVRPGDRVVIPANIAPSPSSHVTARGAGGSALLPLLFNPRNPENKLIRQLCQKILSYDLFTLVCVKSKKNDILHLL